MPSLGSDTHSSSAKLRPRSVAAPKYCRFDPNGVAVPGPDGDVTAESVHLEPLAALRGQGSVDLLRGSQCQTSGESE